MDNKVTKEQIEDVLEETTFLVETVFNKTTIVSAKLPSGFVIVESSSCVDPENYDVKLGTKNCLERIENKLWELEGYKLQHSLTEKK